ncbi:MAG: histidine phosphatase family protein [Anaerolineales bacterium]|nr:histidine phosphatase family protein [Anaerolineales bacterium]MCB8937226.1 histidine phosphatase family protein [Ardenticatenaceae bacterium]
MKGWRFETASLFLLLMSEHLILVRHSAVQIDTAVSSHNWQLSEDGRFRCHTLAAQLQPYNPDRFVTSEENKARETGQILAEVLGLPCAAAAGLQEHDRRGMPYFESKAAFEAAVAVFFARPNELVFGQETAVQARTRFETAVTKLQASYPRQTLGIVSHGTVITLFICAHNPELDPLAFWQSLTLPAAFVLTLPALKLEDVI